VRYTRQYQELQKELHTREPYYGTSGHKHSQHVMELAQRLDTREILDYGCGKQTLQKCIPYPITNYDPFVAGCTDEPEPHDLVVCGDVLEHIEPACLPEVIEHLFTKTKKMLFVDVAQREAKKTLSDGRNAHLIIQSTSWWIYQLAPYFDLKSLQSYDGGFVAAFTPVGASKV
jgi:hypothetical protein